MMQTQSNSSFSFFFNLFGRLKKDHRTRTYKQIVGMFILSLVELAVAGGAALFASSLVDQHRVQMLLVKYLGGFIPQLHGCINSEYSQAVPFALLLCVLVSVLVKNILTGMLSWQGALLSEDIAQYVGSRLFHSYLHQPYIWHSAQNVADLQQLLLFRSNIAAMVVAYSTLCTQLLTFIVLFAGLLLVTPVVTVLVLGVVGSVAYITYVYIKKPAEKRSRTARQTIQAANRMSMAALYGIREVLIYRQQATFEASFARKAYEAGRLNALRPIIGLLPTLILEVAGFFTLCFALALMVFAMGFSTAHVTAVMTMLTAVAWRVMPSINKFLGAALSIRTMAPYVSPILSKIDELAPSLCPQAADDGAILFKKSIGLKSVSFSYVASDALKDITLTIDKGQMVGIVGASGAGKSTLVGILCGLYEPSKGVVSIDGIPLDKQNRQFWMKRIGYVPQSPYLLDGTIAQNIAFSQWDKKADRAWVLECARMAAMDFIEHLPDGIDTQIGDRAMRLSGGQAQRVAIARALYMKPDCIIFDEATSSLDGASEKVIKETVDSFRRGITCILVAHRLTTVESCDIIHVLDNGRIIHSGPPTVILPLYERYMERQHVQA